MINDLPLFPGASVKEHGTVRPSPPLNTVFNTNRQTRNFNPFHSLKYICHYTREDLNGWHRPHITVEYSRTINEWNVLGTWPCASTGTVYLRCNLAVYSAGSIDLATCINVKNHQHATPLWPYLEHYKWICSPASVYWLLQHKKEITSKRVNFLL